jgi:uncharacterized protein CbrC (UPF0167 family)
MTQASFRYFPSFPSGAPLESVACSVCGNTPSISRARLAPTNGEKRPVCADCLAKGAARTDVPIWVEQELKLSVARSHPGWSEQKQGHHISARIRDLSHTPPVPWLQNNEWPTCGDDFAIYIGEITRERLEREHGGEIGGRETLRTILQQALPDWEQDEAAVEAEWRDLGNYLAIFEFLCQDEGRTIYIVQTA